MAVERPADRTSNRRFAWLRQRSFIEICFFFIDFDWDPIEWTDDGGHGRVPLAMHGNRPMGKIGCLCLSDCVCVFPSPINLCHFDRDRNRLADWTAAALVFQLQDAINKILTIRLVVACSRTHENCRLPPSHRNVGPIRGNGQGIDQRSNSTPTQNDVNRH